MLLCMNSSLAIAVEVSCFFSSSCIYCSFFPLLYWYRWRSTACLFIFACYLFRASLVATHTKCYGTQFLRHVTCHSFFDIMHLQIEVDFHLIIYEYNSCFLSFLFPIFHTRAAVVWLSFHCIALLLSFPIPSPLKLVGRRGRTQSSERCSRDNHASNW